MKTGPHLATVLTPAILAVALVAPLAGARAETAMYEIRFDAAWSAETHPEDFPDNPHFSGLVGGTHDDGVSFWEVGELASLGIKRMAEWGSQSPLDEEVQEAIDQGSAQSVLLGTPIWTSPGSTSLEFMVDHTFSLVTLVSMIAPSPDWFVGVSGLELRSQGQWADEIVVQLLPYDAGTDSGPSYDSPDQPTVPPEPISPIADGPVGNGVPLGTFTFTLLEVSAVPQQTPLTLSNAPNPFNPSTEFRFTLPRTGPVKLEVFDPRGHRIATLLDEERDGGSHTLAFSPEDLASGTYLYRLNTAGQTLVGKMTLLK